MHAVAGKMLDPGAAPLWERTKKTAVKLTPRPAIAVLLHSTYSEALVIM